MNQEIPKGQEFTYDVNDELPKYITTYETIITPDELDQRLIGQDTSILIDGEPGDTLKSCGRSKCFTYTE